MRNISLQDSMDIWDKRCAGKGYNITSRLTAGKTINGLNIT